MPKQETCSKHVYVLAGGEYQATNPPRYAWMCHKCGQAEWSTIAEMGKYNLDYLPWLKGTKLNKQTIEPMCISTDVYNPVEPKDDAMWTPNKKRN